LRPVRRQVQPHTGSDGAGGAFRGAEHCRRQPQASGTSKKTGLKLTNVARASLEELRLDYEDYLRQRGLPPWPPDHPALMRFKARRCTTLAEVRAWVVDERHGPPPANTDKQGRAMSGKPSVSASVQVCERPCVPGSAELVANAALSLLNLSCHLLDRQLAAQAAAFVEEGGFTERLYRVRSQARTRPSGKACP